MTCPGCSAPVTDTHRCYNPADRVRARQARIDAEAARLAEHARTALAAARVEVRKQQEETMPESEDVVRRDRYTLVVNGVSMCADETQERQIRAMDTEARARFVTIMDGPR